MYTRILVFSTKLLIWLLRRLGKNASALPGLIVETLSPGFLVRTLEPVQEKIVLITGTNGKTTSTKMAVHALRSIDRRVVTNSTGSNMTRGLISALLDDMTKFGSLREADWFVFEMDEAYAPIFTEKLSVHSVLALNVLRDQLDRYGEIDKTAKLIERAAEKSSNFVFNANDNLLAQSGVRLSAKNINAVSFGVVNKLTSKLRTEQNMYAKSESAQTNIGFMLESATQGSGQQQVSIKHNQEQFEFTVPLEGIHNAMNATGVTALLYGVENEQCAKAVVAIKTMPKPFGRGEVLELNGKKLTVALVKNPSGFTHNLETFVQDGSLESILFVVNDRFADGRDVSWLWDVEFKNIIPKNVRVFCSGIRAYDMAIRLKHDGYVAEVETDVEKAVDMLMKTEHKEAVIIPTYTALYEVRAVLAKYGKVPRIW
jgi:UDP-N-acetylmuramyl tripeptide synthase